MARLMAAISADHKGEGRGMNGSGIPAARFGFYSLAGHSFAGLRPGCFDLI